MCMKNAEKVLISFIQSVNCFRIFYYIIIIIFKGPMKNMRIYSIKSFQVCEFKSLFFNRDV